MENQLGLHRLAFDFSTVRDSSLERYVTWNFQVT
jgi:hypothetical protein